MGVKALGETVLWICVTGINADSLAHCPSHSMTDSEVILLGWPDVTSQGTETGF